MAEALIRKINKVALEYDVEIESRGDTPRARRLKIKLDELKARLARHQNG